MIQDDTFLFRGKGERESHHSGSQVLWEWWLVTTTMENYRTWKVSLCVPHLKRMYHISGQITIIPKPELRGFGCGGFPSLNHLGWPRREVAIICPDIFAGFVESVSKSMPPIPQFWGFQSKKPSDGDINQLGGPSTTVVSLKMNSFLPNFEAHPSIQYRQNARMVGVQLLRANTRKDVGGVV